LELSTRQRWSAVSSPDDRLDIYDNLIAPQNTRGIERVEGRVGRLRRHVISG
jgi:hypothetical protein